MGDTQSVEGHVQLYTQKKPQWHMSLMILYSPQDTKRASQAAPTAGKQVPIQENYESSQAGHPDSEARGEQRLSVETSFHPISVPRGPRTVMGSTAAHSVAGYRSPQPRKAAAHCPAVSLIPTKAETVRNVDPNASTRLPRTALISGSMS